MTDAFSAPSDEAPQAKECRGVGAGGTDLRWTLIDPPFLPRSTPSLEISVLAAALNGEDTTFDRPDLVREFADRIGADAYDRLSSTQGPLGVGDFIGGAGLRAWLAGSYSGGGRDELAEFLSHIVETQGFPIRWQPAVHLAADAAVPFVEDWAARLSDRPRLVVLHAKYQQLAFALSLAEALARREAGHRILLTGELVHHADVAEALLDLFPFIDGVDRASAGSSPAAQRGTLLEEAPAPLGLATRASAGATLAPIRTALEGPVLNPDFGSFHDDGSRPGDASVPLRLSVGCAWADRTVCSFCGLIPDGQSYVIARPEEARDAILRAVERTGCRRVVLADLMVDERLIEGVFAPLATLAYDLEIYAEVRPDLPLEALQTLRRAGVGEILAGIESLDLDTLKALRKGAHPAAMIRFLRDVESAGIALDWQILHGLPLDTPERAAAQAELAGRLRHLPAPFSASPIRLERSSPMIKSPETFGFRVTGPARHTALAFAPLPEAELMRFCNEFAHDVNAPETHLAATRRSLVGAVTDWVRARREGERMAAYRMPGGTEVHVTRSREGTTRYTLDATETEILNALDRPADRRSLARRLPHVPSATLDACLADFDAAGLVVEAGGRLVHVVPRAR